MNEDYKFVYVIFGKFASFLFPLNYKNTLSDIENELKELMKRNNKKITFFNYLDWSLLEYDSTMLKLKQLKFADIDTQKNLEYIKID